MRQPDADGKPVALQRRVTLTNGQYHLNPNVMARFRPVSKFRNYTNQALADAAQGTHDALSAAVGTFATPSVSLSLQQTAIDNFNAAILAWGIPGNQGSDADHVALLAARAVVEENLRSLEGYVNGVAAGDLGIIMLAAMVPQTVSGPYGVLPAPQNVHSPFSKHTAAGQYRLRWKKVKGGAAYIVWRSDDALGTNKIFVKVVTRTLAIVESPSLPSLTLQYFWVQAVGSAGDGLMSDVCAARNP